MSGILSWKWTLKKTVDILKKSSRLVLFGRHWAHLNTTSLEEEIEGKGKLVELFGFTHATTLEDGKLTD
eukprot:6837830-Ditylum_brightwellii.AAC.1